MKELILKVGYILLKEMEKSKSKIIIFFDGVCNFCDDAVNFIIKKDKKNIFVFAPLQSQAGREFLSKHNLNTEIFDSMVVVKEEKIFRKSNASLLIARHLPFPWPLFYLFKLVPFFIRDFFYDLFAKYRYRIFGKKESCMIPTAEVRAKFLE
jgi:predicted DCC family thiol-disulfide oxidoreductase YuxK